MNVQEIEQVIFEIISKITDREETELSVETKLAEDLGIKSIGRIELAALLEDKFPLQISNFEIRKPKSINELVELVRAKI